MIYYFSGTGNSRWVAKELATLTGDEAVSITEVMKHDGPTAAFCFGKDARIGLVFPIYAWGAPRIMDDFINTLVIDPDVYAYAVCTCGDEAGRAMQKLKRRFPWKAAWSVIMPNNYIPMYDVDAPALERAKIAAASERLPLIADRIKARETVTDVQQGGLAGLKTAVVNPIFKAFASSTKPFAADAVSIGCGQCARNCPVDAIQLSDGRPQWIKKHCVSCMACIHRCPVKAIQYGGQTRSKGRYRFPENGWESMD